MLEVDFQMELFMIYLFALTQDLVEEQLLMSQFLVDKLHQSEFRIQDQDMFKETH
jgi:hypothetical protein